MQITEITFNGPIPVDSYGPGFFRVAGELVEGPLAMLPGHFDPWQGFDDIKMFLAAAATIDVLLVGMGAEIAPMPADIRTKLEDAGIGVEVMATPSACRTYNILLSEGRRVGAALLAV